MSFEKIRPHHLERKAILYVRQSSAYQVLHNRESSALQYAMRDRLSALGWSRIETVDDDLGRSAAGGVIRAGFERMVAEVCLGKVGAVAAPGGLAPARDALMRDLEAARYAADRAFRQYDAADPLNRLVTGELETRWNKALARVTEVEGKITAHDGATPSREVASISPATLAGDLKSVWSAPTTGARLKKRIVRTVIREVVADIDAEAAEIILVIHWMGGIHTELRLPRRRGGQRNSTAPDIIAAVRHLVLIANDDLIAGILNRNGLVTGNGNRWTRERVTSLRSNYTIPAYRPAQNGMEPYLNLSKAASLLSITLKTLRLATEAGEIDALHPLPDGPWTDGCYDAGLYSSSHWSRSACKSSIEL